MAKNGEIVDLGDLDPLTIGIGDVTRDVFVRPSHAGVELILMIVQSYAFYHRVARDSLFSRSTFIEYTNVTDTRTHIYNSYHVLGHA